MKLKYEKGTIKLVGEYNIPHGKWDSREVSQSQDSNPRAQGFRYKDIIEYLDNSSLEYENLIDKNSLVHLSDTYETRLLEKLSKKFDLEKVLTGKKEEILKSIISKPKKIPYLEREGFGKSTLYEALNDLKEVGAVVEEEKGYKINDETLFDFIKIREGSQFMESYSTKTEKIIKTGCER